MKPLSLLAWIARAAVPPLPAARVGQLLGLGLFALGAAISQGFLVTTLGPEWIAAPPILLAACAWLASYPGRSPAWRALRVFAWAALLGAYATWSAVAAAFGLALAWAVPAWVFAVVAALAAASLWSTRPGSVRPGLPLSFALGVLILAGAIGWKREDGLVRCDDYLRLAADPSVRIAIPSSPELGACTPGERLVVDRYPRFLKEMPDRSGLLFTTQTGSAGQWNPGARMVGDLAGSICVSRGDASRPTCSGEGTAQGILDAPELGRVFIAIFTRPPKLIELPWPGELRFLRELDFEGKVGDGFYDRRSQTVFLYTDEGTAVYPVDATTLQPLPRIEAPMTGGEVAWNDERREGVICGGNGPLLPVQGKMYAAVAVRAGPFESRPLGAQSQAWALTAFSWGCDIDPAARRVYSALVLGRLAVLDYDSGEVLRTHWIGVGRRPVTLDLRRNRLYTASFFSGEVQAFDLRTFREVGRWFPGRFVRRIVLSDDGESLLVSSNVGVIRIPLEGSGAVSGAPQPPERSSYP